MGFERILALTDLSPNSAAGLDLADVLALRLGARIIIGYAHTRTDVRRDLSPDRGEAERLAQWVREDDEASLRALVERHIDKTRLLSTETTEAPGAREGALELIRRVRPDLVCMATRGRTGISHLLLGSVAEHTLRTAGVPVAVTRGGPLPAQGEPMRLLVAHDLMEDPGLLATRAGALLTVGDEVIHAHVVETWYYSSSAYGSELEFPQPDVPRLVDVATERLRRIPPVDGRRASVEVATGRPGDGLLELESRCRPHLIVVRTHGRRGFDRMLLGSVSEFVARKAKAAVVVFPKGD
jgi:nucleotide-binding universal stress UspA family protein